VPNLMSASTHWRPSGPPPAETPVLPEIEPLNPSSPTAGDPSIVLVRAEPVSCRDRLERREPARGKVGNGAVDRYHGGTLIMSRLRLLVRPCWLLAIVALAACGDSHDSPPAAT